MHKSTVPEPIILTPCSPSALTMPAKVLPSREWCQQFTLVVVIVVLAVVRAMEAGHTAAARHLIDATQSNVFHLDLLARGKRPGSRSEEGPEVPWFDGFPESEMPAAVTVGHPIRRMLLHLKEEMVEVEEAMSWAQGSGKPADELTFYRRGYQIVDNYLVRVLAGQAAWELPPGDVGKIELQAARVALGKFEVLLRADCLATDLPLLLPYLAKEVSNSRLADMVGETEAFLATEAYFLPLGTTGQQLLRANRWDLQLWEFAHKLVPSRSTRVESFLCSSSNASRGQRLPGAGRRAVVYNSPPYHLTGVAMFSCALVSLGFDVTVVMKEPGAGYADLLPCPNKVVTLDGHYTNETTRILDAETAASLGLPPLSSHDGRALTGEQIRRGRASSGGGLTGSESGPRFLGDEEGREVGQGKGEGERENGDGNERRKGNGPFDLSVLCTVVSDLNHLMKPTYPMDSRLVDALLWDVEVSIWNMHSVEGVFRHGMRVPFAVNDFARRLPSPGDGRTPPPTFLTLYGEHVELWERWSEEAYEGWGWSRPDEDGLKGEAASTKTIASAAVDGYSPRGNSSFGALFRRPGVVYPIHPTGHMRLPRPKLPFAGGVAEGKRGGDSVTFVVQGNMQSYRRDYKLLMRCLEAMCSSGRANYELVAVGARGEMPEEISAHPCVENRTTERRHLPFPEFYSNISAGHFVVTAAAGHGYEFDRATSSVPTALLLERPLVMSTALLDAYPCLRKSRVHSMVANDDLCLNLQAAYDLTPEEYNEMELEARDCKLEMWRTARQTVAAMASGWTLD